MLVRRDRECLAFMNRTAQPGVMSVSLNIDQRSAEGLKIDGLNRRLIENAAESRRFGLEQSTPRQRTMRLL